MHSEKDNIQTALLVGTYAGSTLKTQCEEQLEELKNLAHTFHLTTVHKVEAPLRTIDVGTFLGKGKVEEIKELVQTHKADVVIFDDLISPQQQKNLETIFEKPVIDRTELILGIFAERAHTKEAKLQIELASVRYQMPRLKRLWTHLSRQRTGGAGGGFLKGEGEKQIELDRRILQRKLDQIQRELKEVKKHRETQRRSREKSQIPTFAIIGYTNVGKSTLLNALTHANVLAEDKLFATLDTTTRKFTLPNKQQILLIDTVGFIRKIPHELIAAFKSTLEEAVLADILLHLVDASHPSALIQAEATFEVLKELNAANRPIITVFNKIDQCKSPSEVDRLRFRFPKSVPISALNGTGFDRLLELMMKEISLLRKKYTLRIPQSQYQLMNEIRKEGQVLSCEYEENDMIVEVEIPKNLEFKVTPFEVTQ